MMRVCRGAVSAERRHLVSLTEALHVHVPRCPSAPPMGTMSIGINQASLTDAFVASQMSVVAGPGSHCVCAGSHVRSFHSHTSWNNQGPWPSVHVRGLATTTNSDSSKDQDTDSPTSSLSPVSGSDLGTAAAGTTSAGNSNGEGDGVTSSSWLPKWMLKEHIVAKPGFNRWLVPPASVGIHLCIGSVYAFSIFNSPLTRELGIVAPAAHDWTLGSVVPIFSTAIVFLGLSAAAGGSWLEKVGPRAVGAISACLWGGGFMVAAAGVQMHSLPLLYAGYGVLGGIGLGLGYVSPVSTLIRWFPDRRGLATGLAIMGFGGGGMVATKLIDSLIARNFRAPDYLGGAEEIEMMTDHSGVRTANIGGQMKEVVVASASDLASLPVTLPEGVYVVGTGSTGAAATFAALGLGYFGVMLASSFSYRVPAADWTPAGWTPPAPPSASSTSSAGMITTRHVHVDQALKTPQFYLLWTALLCNVSAGIAVISTAKLIMTDIFSTTAAFASTYVLMVSVFNMGGRLLWASASDFIGRKNAYHTFFLLGMPLYASIPLTAAWASGAASTAPLVLFYSSTMLIFSMYGGGFATLPAYIADVFGTRYVGAIHGRMLTAWSTAGIMGPMALTQLRERSVERAIQSLANVVSQEDFEHHFGAPLDELPALVEAKTVTIAKLMEIAPLGTIDPTPTLYDSTMYTMTGVLGIAAVANALIKPVDPKHYMVDDTDTTTVIDVQSTPASGTEQPK